MNETFYERLLVARFIQEKFAQQGVEKEIQDVFYFVQAAGDSTSIDYLWFSITGGYVTWEDHLEDVCFKVLKVGRKQPGYSPFNVSEDTLNLDEDYAFWYYNEWLPYLYSIVREYSYIWEPRLSSKVTRGMVNIIDIINEEIDNYSNEFGAQFN